MQRVVLHVGLPKTGTTYLQALLAGHRDALREAGVLYPFVKPQAMFLGAVEVLVVDPFVHELRLPRRVGCCVPRHRPDHVVVHRHSHLGWDRVEHQPDPAALSRGEQPGHPVDELGGESLAGEALPAQCAQQQVPVFGRGCREGGLVRSPQRLGFRRRDEERVAARQLVGLHGSRA